MSDGPEKKLPCGCYATVCLGYGVRGEGFVVTASAFLCPHRHEQGAYVMVEESVAHTTIARDKAASPFFAKDEYR